MDLTKGPHDPCTSDEVELLMDLGMVPTSNVSIYLFISNLSFNDLNLNSLYRTQGSTAKNSWHLFVRGYGYRRIASSFTIVDRRSSLDSSSSPTMIPPKFFSNTKGKTCGASNTSHMHQQLPTTKIIPGDHRPSSTTQPLTTSTALRLLLPLLMLWNISTTLSFPLTRDLSEASAPNLIWQQE